MGRKKTEHPLDELRAEGTPLEEVWPRVEGAQPLTDEEWQRLIEELRARWEAFREREEERWDR